MSINTIEVNKNLLKKKIGEKFISATSGVE